MSGDDDRDGIINKLEYAFGTDPHSPDYFEGPDIQSLTVGAETADYLTLSFKRPVAVEDLTYHVEFATDLDSWDESAVLVGTAANGDGTLTETWRAPSSVGSEPRCFLRVRVSP